MFVVLVSLPRGHRPIHLPFSLVGGGAMGSIAWEVFRVFFTHINMALYNFWIRFFLINWVRASCKIALPSLS
jgi:hypothetical protein